MGAVWLAEDTRLHRQVALKTLRSADDPDARSRAGLMREARAAAALNHPHIATAYDVLEHDGQVVIVFEYVEGETLSAWLAREAMPASEAVGIASQIAQALVAAHALGIVHRDLKPANVIVGAGGQVKVLDFGIARLLSIGTTQTAGKGGETASGPGFIGTPGYAAPEQMVSSAVDERADLYALGVMLFEMISGRRPFPGNDAVALASSKLGQDAPPLSSTGGQVPPDLERLVAALLMRDPDHRPASAADVLAQLRAVYGLPVTGALAPRSRRRVLAPVLIGAVVLVAAVAIGLWSQVRPAPETSSPPTPPVVAVLPLSNISGDPSKEFVAAGIAESLITSLAALPTVTVLSRASVTEARGRSAGPSALAKDLGVTYFVEGSIQESGGQLRVTLNLVRFDRSVAWGDRAEGRLDQIFDLQARLAMMLTAALNVRVSPAERQRMTAQVTASTEALTAYWQGRALMDRRNVRGNLDAAVAAFSKALTLDSRFALAHAALGEAYWFQYVDTREPTWSQKATDAGFTALRLDADEPVVRYTLAVTLAGTGKLEEAASELRGALALQPNYDDARRQLGEVLARQGKVDEAIDEFRKAIAARPDYWGNYSAMGVALYTAGRYPDAIVAFKRVTDLQPDGAMGYQQLGTVFHQIGDKPQALENYQKAIAIRPVAQAYSNVGMLYHQQKDYARAVEAYRQAITLRPNFASTHGNLGDALLKSGHRREALEAYRQAVALAERDLKVNPRNPLTLASLALYLQKAGRGGDAQERLAQALGLASGDNQVWHRAAKVHALAGRAAEALSALRQAIKHGYSRAAAAEDDEFESLRTTPGFIEVVGRSSSGDKTP